MKTNDGAENIAPGSPIPAATGPARSRELMTYREVADELNMPIGTVCALVKQARIPHVRLGKRIVRFPRAAIEEWLAAMSVAPAKARR